MNWIGRIGIGAGIFILIGFPLFYKFSYPSMIANDKEIFAVIAEKSHDSMQRGLDDADFERELRACKKFLDYFKKALDKKAEEEGQNREFKGELEPCLSRQEVRRFFKPYGAACNAQEHKDIEFHVISDMFYWETYTKWGGVIVSYQETDDGQFYFPSDFHGVQTFLWDRSGLGPWVAPLGIIWMATLVIMGLRLRAYLSKKREVAGTAPPRPALAGAGEPSGRSRHQAGVRELPIWTWKAGLALAAAIAIACIYLLALKPALKQMGGASRGILSGSASTCANCRTRFSTAVELLRFYFPKRPDPQDLIQNFTRYRDRYLEECMKRAKERCERHEIPESECRHGCDLFPKTVEAISCPDGGRYIYLLDEGTKVWCSKHSGESNF